MFSTYTTDFLSLVCEQAKNTRASADEGSHEYSLKYSLNVRRAKQRRSFQFLGGPKSPSCSASNRLSDQARIGYDLQERRDYTNQNMEKVLFKVHILFLIVVNMLSDDRCVEIQVKNTFAGAASTF